MKNRNFLSLVAYALGVTTAIVLILSLLFLALVGALALVESFLTSFL